jgi:uncharacterized protein
MRAVLVFLIAFGLVSCDYAEKISGGQQMLPQAPLIIETENGPVRFTVEMAMTGPQKERGLMYRRTLAPDAGMFFDLGNERQIAFWMKNTIIPLDMLFIKANGTVARIAADTKPYSQDNIPSYEPVRAVLEIPGGRAAQLGLKAGDLVRQTIFGNMPR